MGRWKKANVIRGNKYGAAAPTGGGFLGKKKGTHPIGPQGSNRVSPQFNQVHSSSVWARLTRPLKLLKRTQKNGDAVGSMYL